MSSSGLGGDSAFSSYHPVVNILFYVMAVGMAMFQTRPLFIGISFAMAVIYAIILGGTGSIKKIAFFLGPIFLVMAVLNGLFSHNGDTVLLYINGSRITMEAFLYGILSASIISLVIVWFMTFNIIMNGEKIIYLFGRGAPVLGLTLSMIFRFIPLLKARYQEIHLGQRCMGRHSGKTLVSKLRQTGKEISILTSWSLESSIETADSMEARGYGLKGRTSFHLFKMKTKDVIVLLFMAVFGGVAIAGIILGKTTAEYFPVFSCQELDMATIAIALSYLALLSMPILIDIVGEMKWKQLESKI